MILEDPSGFGQNLTLIKEAMAEDWNTRPNNINPVEGIGPFPEGLQQIMGLWSVIIPDIFIRRQQTLTCTNSDPKYADIKYLVVQSRFGATVTGLPSGFTEIPFFPGVEVEKIMGKKFETMALDIQVLDSVGKKIIRTWHLEDWADALVQMLTG